MSKDALVNIDALVRYPILAEHRVLKIQTKLHCWAAAEADRRFDDLFNLVADPAFLVVAWNRVRRNKGARTAGIDAATAASMESRQHGVTGFLTDLRLQVKDRRFTPVPVRTVQIPKANGKVRRLGIPTVTDRVVQASLKLVLEPILEAGFDPSSYGFRPGRRCQDAIEEIRFLAVRGYDQVFEGDIAACFDEIDHAALLGRLRRRVGDKKVLSLVKAFLRAGLLDELSAYQDTTTGTPQGGILSPLLANVALAALDDHFRARWAAMGTQTQRYRAQQRGAGTYRLIRYADDFVVMVNGSRDQAASLYRDTEVILEPLGLRLATDKTKITSIDEGFDFLGFHIQRHQQRGSNRRLIYTYPAKMSLNGIRAKVRAATRRQTTSLPASVTFRRLGKITRGWASYFRHGSSSRAFAAVQHHLWWSVWRWLRKKHPNRNAAWIVHHYYVPGQWWPKADGVRLFQPCTVAIERYRFRGTNIPNPWQNQTHTA